MGCDAWAFNAGQIDAGWAADTGTCLPDAKQANKKSPAEAGL